jgi:hypothetical protein
METPNTPMSLVNLMPSTSDEINRFSNVLIQSVKNGDEDPLTVLVQIRAMEKAFKIIVEKIKDNYLSESEKYPGDKFQFKGNDIQKGDVHTEYDYTVTGDPIWYQRKSILDMAKNLLDERQEFLKTLREPITIVDDESGEVATVRPPLKKTTPGLKVTIK